LLLALAAVLDLVGCHPDQTAREEMETQRARLEGMLSTNAGRLYIVGQLGTNNFYYQTGGEHWHALEEFVERNPEAKKKLIGYHRVLYYTTADVMTWLLLDEEERMANVYLCWQ